MRVRRERCVRPASIDQSKPLDWTSREREREQSRAVRIVKTGGFARKARSCAPHTQPPQTHISITGRGDVIVERSDLGFFSLPGGVVFRPGCDRVTSCIIPLRERKRCDPQLPKVLRRLGRALLRALPPEWWLPDCNGRKPALGDWSLTSTSQQHHTNTRRKPQAASSAKEEAGAPAALLRRQPHTRGASSIRWVG